jgi:nucleotide-binding universal stress UspA family protein
VVDRRPRVGRDDREPVASTQPLRGEDALHARDQVERGAVGDLLSIADEGNAFRIARERPKCLGANGRSVVDGFEHLVTTVHLQRAEESMMKTILDQDIPAVKSTLETALLLAKRIGAYVEGVPLWFGVPEFVVAELASSFSVEIYRARRGEGTAGARKLFETFMEEHRVAARSTADRPTFGWFAEVPPGEGLVGSHGRAFDVIVMSRPDANTTAPYNRAIESGLFESGRPILLSRPTAPNEIATNIMIRWNGSTEQARANAFAMPLLHLAERVTALTVVGGKDVPGPSADQVRKQLQYNGIAAELMSIELEGRDTGEAVLAAAKADGCDLLIKGAFTRNRLRQTIFGGATSHIMQHADLPLFMAH